MGTQSSPQSVHFQNTGLTVLVFTKIQVTQNFAETDTCKPSLAVGANCDVKVTFNPMAVGPLTGTLTVTTNAPGPPYEVNLSGTGTQTAPNITPASLTFNDQAVRTTSAPQTVTVTNTSALALSFTGLSVSNGFIQNNNCLPSLAPNAFCTINVSFQPASSGVRNGTLTLTDYAENSPQTVTVSGMGVAPAVNLSPTSLNFSGQSVSTTSAAQTVTLTNSGNGPLGNLTIVASGDFAQTNNCSNSVAASNSCTINVTFTPTAPGNRTGALTLTDNAAGSPQTVSLSGGTGGSPAWLVTSSLAFSDQQVGTTSPQVTLQVFASQALNITDISIGGANSGDFRLSQNCVNSQAPSAACQITVTFAPTATGERSATVSINDNAANSPQMITLTGTGTPGH